MIKEEYIGTVVTITNGSVKRKIEIYEGMLKEEIEILKNHGIEVEEPKKTKAKKYKAIEQPKEDENTDEEINTNGEA